MKVSLKILITILFLSATDTFAVIAKKDCQESYNFSNRFPPVRDQDGHGLCWSFAAAALYEEALCLESKKDKTVKYECGQKVSVLDMARCDFAIGSGFSEGGNSDQALKCVLSEKADYLTLKRVGDKSASVQKTIKEHKPGVCLESRAPFYNLKNGLSGLYDEIFKGVSDPKSFNDYLVEIYRDCTNCKTKKTNNTKLDETVAVLKKMLPKQESYGVDFRKALTQGLTDEEFLRQILITPSCEKNRLDLSDKYQVKSEDFSAYTRKSIKWINGKLVTEKTNIPEATTSKKFESLKKSLKNGRSVEASICFNKYKSEKKNSFLENLFGSFAGPVSENDCGGHAIVLAGLRWNNEKNQCETFVRNSWGSGASLNGWVKAENVLDATFGFSQMVKK
jgi:hypothetical protein